MMLNRALIVTVGLLSCLLVPRDSVAATGTASPILLQKSQSELELDLGMMVRDLLPPILEAMKLDKKVVAGSMRIVLPVKIGKVKIEKGIGQAEIRRLFRTA